MKVFQINDVEKMITMLPLLMEDKEKNIQVFDSRGSAFEANTILVKYEDNKIYFIKSGFFCKEEDFLSKKHFNATVLNYNHFFINSDDKGPACVVYYSSCKKLKSVYYILNGKAVKREAIYKSILKNKISNL